MPPELRQQATELDRELGQLRDIDLLPTGEWVGVFRAPSGQVVRLGDVWFSAPRSQTLSLLGPGEKNVSIRDLAAASRLIRMLSIGGACRLGIEVTRKGSTFGYDFLAGDLVSDPDSSWVAEAAENGWLVMEFSNADPASEITIDELGRMHGKLLLAGLAISRPARRVRATATIDGGVVDWSRDVALPTDVSPGIDEVVYVLMISLRGTPEAGTTTGGKDSVTLRSDVLDLRQTIAAAASEFSPKIAGEMLPDLVSKLEQEGVGTVIAVPGEKILEE